MKCDTTQSNRTDDNTVKERHTIWFDFFFGENPPVPHHSQGEQYGKKETKYHEGGLCQSVLRPHSFLIIQWIRPRHLMRSTTHDVVSREINLGKGFDLFDGIETVTLGTKWRVLNRYATGTHCRDVPEHTTISIVYCNHDWFVENPFIRQKFKSRVIHSQYNFKKRLYVTVNLYNQVICILQEIFR